jgi:hypothetical protein
LGINENNPNRDDRSHQKVNQLFLIEAVEKTPLRRRRAVERDHTHDEKDEGTEQ